MLRCRSEHRQAPGAAAPTQTLNHYATLASEARRRYGREHDQFYLGLAKSGEQIAWIENDHDVYSVVTKRKFATVRDGKLYSLSGEFLNIHLDNLHSENADLVSGARDTEALAGFKKLANES
jgi:hypothetical protein